MRNRTLILAAAAVLALGVSVRAEETTATEQKPATTEVTPVPGGMSDRLAALRDCVKNPETFREELSKSLEKSRQEAHKLIDELVDSEHFDAWLEAMADKDDTGFAEQLKGKPSEQVRSALHGRLERRLSKLGREIAEKIQGETPERLQASFELALRDLAREEENLQKASDAVADAPSAPADAPKAPAWAYMNAGGVRTYNAYGYARTPAYNRTLAIAQQRAYFSNQLAARAWNNRVNSFNTYLYGARRPAYASQRYMAYYQSRRFPAGYYYRPDRVERVVRRGLWGVAAVAATPFALLAGMF